MRWQKNIILIPLEQIASKIIELNEKGISSDKFALAYARVSTKHNEQKGSKENQIEDCKKYALKEGLVIIYTFECAESARNMGRKVFNTLIETALNYNIKNLIFKDQSRLARNLGDKYQINELIEEDKIKIHFYLDNQILDSNSDLDFSDIKAVFDQRFSRLLSQKMKWAAKDRKEKGIPYHAPIGYRFGKDSKGETNTTKMEFDPSYEKIIREVVDLFLKDHKTCEEIADEFNAMGYHTSRKNKFYSSTIHRILINKAYTGKYFLDKGEWKTLKIFCPPYITEEEYNEIQ